MLLEAKSLILREDQGSKDIKFLINSSNNSKQIRLSNKKEKCHMGGMEWGNALRFGRLVSLKSLIAKTRD